MFVEQVVHASHEFVADGLVACVHLLVHLHRNDAVVALATSKPYEFSVRILDHFDLHQYFDFVKQNGYFDYRRNEQSKYWMYESINEHLRLNFYNNPLIKSQLASAESSVLAGQKTSFIAAQDLLDEYFKLLKK